MKTPNARPSSNLRTRFFVFRGLSFHCAVLGLAATLLAPLLHAAQADEFAVWSFDRAGDGSVELPGRLYIPDNYDPTQSYPLVIFYHGSGASGTNNTSQVSGSIGVLFQHAKTQGFFLYAPQTADDFTAAHIDASMRMVANAAAAYHIDSTKIYATGLSLGGGAVWDVVNRYHSVLAASVPLCGIFGADIFEGANLVGEPIWIFHARNDPSVDIAVSQNAVNEIRAADGLSALNFPLDGNYKSPFYTDGSKFYDRNNLRFTEYSSGGHTIWDRAYDEAPLYTWLFEHEESGLGLRPGEILAFDFGTTPATSPTGDSTIWNGYGSGDHRTPGVVTPFARTTSGRRSGISLGIDAQFGATVNYNPGYNGRFPASVASDGWITPQGATADSGAGRLVIRHLNPGAPYRIEIFATNANSDSGRGRSSRYAIGHETRDLEATANTLNTAAFEQVFADDQGTLELTVFPNPTTNSRYGQINTLTVEALIPPPPLQAWLDRYFSPEEQLDEEHGGLSGDADSDGLANLVEYALGQLPRETSHLVPFQPDVFAGTLTSEFERSPDHDDITIEVQHSSDLATDQWSTWAHSLTGGPFTDLSDGQLQIAESGEPPDPIRVSVAYALADQEAHFLRLQVTTAE